MAKFTRGPWNIHRAYPLDTEVRTTTPSADCPEPFDYWHGVIAQGDKIIAEARMQTSQNGGWPHIEDLEEARANALLMCAAPCLYAALRAIEADHMSTGELSPETISLAHAALAKADGTAVLA